MPPSAPTRSRFAIGLLGLSSLITGLDFTIVYVALPDIDRELGFTGGQVQWVVSAYALTFGGFLLLFGRLSDLLGRRRIFVFGMLLFAAASLLGTLGDTPAVLLVARALQGVGAAALFPSTLSLVTSTFPDGPARGRAMTVWAASGASGLSLGALLGGILTEIDWRGVFLVTVPLTALAAVGAVLVLAPDAGRIGRGGFDPIGAITGTTAATLFVLTVSQLSEPGVSLTSVLITGLAAAVLAGVFLRTEATARAPMLPLSLFAHRELRVAMVVIAAFGITLQSIPYLLTIHFRTGLDLTALQAGLAFLLPTGAITIGNLAGERLLARYGPRVVLTTGLLIGAAGAALLVPAVATGTGYLAMAPGLAVAGLGMGLVFPAMFTAATTGVPAEHSGVASGAASSALQFGTAIGLAVVSGLLAHPAAGLAAGLAVIAIGALAAIVPALLVPRVPDGLTPHR
ncbi:MFS transporter [Actinomycetes bacterium KLBMP 9759]